MLVKVAVLQTPSHLAAQGGEEETILIPSTEVVARDEASALLIVGAQNAAKLNADGVKQTFLRTIVQVVG